MRKLGYLALALNGFAIIVVNYSIYTARWDFIERHPEYTKPPTISRAISDPSIGEPFSFWVSLSGICLVIGVALLAIQYLQVISRLEAPARSLKMMAWVCLPLIVVLQLIAAIGMHLLSTYRFPDAHEMHMVGSYTFFIAQALVVVLFTAFNYVFLRGDTGRLSRVWMRIRYVAGWVAIALTGAYFALFTAKDVWEFDVAPTLYMAYVTTEPMVISAFLLVLGLCHGDMHSRRVHLISDVAKPSAVGDLKS